jgi:hypothetical protein
MNITTIENERGELITDDDTELVPDSYFESADAKFGYPPLDTES